MNYEKIGSFAGKIASQKHLLAVRDGLVTMMPLTIVGSIFIIIAELPIQAYQNFMTNLFGAEFWGDFCWGMAFPATLGLASLVTVASVAYCFTQNEGIEGLPASAIALASYFMVLEGTAGFEAYKGAEGLFVAILIGLIVGEIYTRFIKKDIVIHLPDSVPPTIMRSFIALIPAVVILALFFILRVVMSFTPYGTIHSLIVTVIQAPLQGFNNSFIGTFLSCTLTSVLWTLGLHGDQIVGAITNPIVEQAFLANAEAWSQGLEPTFINAKGFLDVFLNFGGTGSVLGLVIAMKFGCKSKAIKQISSVALVPSLFNISEPVVFGLPVVLNPIMVIPFICTTMVNTCVTYAAFYFDFVHKIVVAPPWTTPIFFSGYLATGGDFMGVVLQVILLAISFAIYFPFVKSLDRTYIAKEKAEAEAVAQEN